MAAAEQELAVLQARVSVREVLEDSLVTGISEDTLKTTFSSGQGSQSLLTTSHSPMKTVETFPELESLQLCFPWGLRSFSPHQRSREMNYLTWSLQKDHPRYLLQLLA